MDRLIACAIADLIRYELRDTGLEVQVGRQANVVVGMNMNEDSESSLLLPALILLVRDGLLLVGGLVFSGAVNSSQNLIDLTEPDSLERLMPTVLGHLEMVQASIFAAARGWAGEGEGEGEE